MPASGTGRADALLLAPGAGSDSNHATLRAIDDALAPMPVRRMDFPYRLAGRRAPDRAPVLIESVRAALDDLSAAAKVSPDRVVLGGRSMGGRICSMLAAEPDVTVAGLILISYPLHPPGKPDRLRIEHFGALDLPVLFISGTRDPFGTPEEFEREVAAIPGPVEFVWLDGGRHDLAGVDDRIVDTVRTWLTP